MNVGYLEAMITPFEVVLQDLEFMELQAKYGEKQPENENKKGLTNGNSK